MNISEITQGQAFTATINDSNVKGHIYIENKDYFYLCQDEANGAESPVKFGHTYSWAVRIKPNGDIKFTFHDVGNFTLLKEVKKVDYKKVNTLAGYTFKKNSREVKFGCGEVTLPVSSIKAFVKISNILKERGLELTELDWKVLNAQFS